MRRILLLQTAFLGDVVLATPLIEKLHAHFPNAALDFVLRKGNEGLLRQHPHVRRVWIWNKSQKWRSAAQLVRQWRREDYDLAINLQRFFTSGMLALGAGARQVIGFDKNPLSRFYHTRIPHVFGTDEQFVHEVSRNLALITPLTDASFVRPRLYPSAEEYAAAVRPRPYICLAPTSVWFTKQWPLAQWADLLDRTTPELDVLLLGGPADRAFCDQLASATRHPQVFNLAGELSLLASAALMQGARMNYVNDSAPLHMASAMNAPVTAIFCSTVPAFGFTPLSDRTTLVQTPHALDCRPCGLHGYRACPQGHFRCAQMHVPAL